MEGAAQPGDQRETGRIGLELPQRVGRIGDHLARLLEEDVAHLVIVLQAGRREGGRLGQRRRRQRTLGQRRPQRIEVQRRGRGGDEVLHRLDRLRPPGAIGLRQRLAGRLEAIAEHRHRRHPRLVLQRLQLRGDLVERQRRLPHRLDQRLGALDHVDIDRRAPHQRRQHAQTFVEDEQGARHLRLHAQHVDQEAERAQIGRQTLEGAQRDRILRPAVVVQQLLDIGAHALQRRDAGIEPQHREHAAHRAELARHRRQQAALARGAEELVDLALDLEQRAAQLLHHAAQGLAVADPAVEFLHPGLERLGGMAGQHPADALGQPVRGRGHAAVEIARVDRGLEIEQAGRDLHAQLGLGRAAAAQRRLGGLAQGAGQRTAVGVEPADRIAHQREGLAQMQHALRVAGRSRIPGLLGGLQATARLQHQRRITPAVERLVIADQRLGHQMPGGMDRTQPRRRLRLGRPGTRAVEQQILGQTVGQVRIALDAAAQLRHHPRGAALDIQVGRQQRQRPGLEEGRGQPPQRLLMACAGRAQHRALARQRGRGARMVLAHQHQQRLLEARQLRRVGRLHQRRRHLDRGRQRMPLPVAPPQIGRMNALGAGQLQQRAPLREQPDRLHRLAGELARQEVEQREQRLLDRLDAGAVQALRPRHEALHQLLGRTHHQRGLRQVDQLERAGALMDLLAGLAQDGRIDIVEVRAVGLADLAQVAAQRLLGRLQRAAQLVMDPGKCAEIVGRGGVSGR